MKNKILAVLIAALVVPAYAADNTHSIVVEGVTVEASRVKMDLFQETSTQHDVRSEWFRGACIPCPPALTTASK